MAKAMRNTSNWRLAVIANIFVLYLIIDNGNMVCHALVESWDAYIEKMAQQTMDAMSASEMNDTVTAMHQMDVRAAAAVIGELPELPELPSTVDCFGLPSWIATPLRNLFKTSSRMDVNTRFYLSTRVNERHQEVMSGEASSLEGTGFDPRHRTYIIVHGFLADGQIEWIQQMVTALLNRNESNVIAVDWSGGGGSWKYWKAVANTRVTGYDLTRFVLELMTAGMAKENLHLIGHSLGAHICGFVSRNLNGVGRITGLDPAQPCFRVSDPRMTLDKSDASFVDIIHTNGRILSKVGLGLPYNIGHVDFYPNGGMVQPGCVSRRSLSVLGFITRNLKAAVCSHGRAYDLFVESITQRDECVFWGHPWNRTMKTMKSAVKAPCDATSCTEMGLNTVDYPARGSFVFKTEKSVPFCVPDLRTDEKMGVVRAHQRPVTTPADRILIR